MEMGPEITTDMDLGPSDTNLPTYVGIMGTRMNGFHPYYTTCMHVGMHVVCTMHPRTSEYSAEIQNNIHHLKSPSQPQLPGWLVPWGQGQALAEALGGVACRTRFVPIFAVGLFQPWSPGSPAGSLVPMYQQAS